MKYIKYMGIFIIMLLVVGCSKEEIYKTCSIVSDQSSNGYKSTIKYDIYHKGDIVTKVVQREVIDSDKKDILDFYNDEYQSMYKKYNKTYGGYNYDVNVKDNQLVLDVSIDYNKFNMEKYIEDNTGLKKYTNKNGLFTLDGIVKMYENIGASCK